MSENSDTSSHDRANNEPIEEPVDPSAEAAPADPETGAAEPSTEPSTEKDPGEEPKAARPHDPSPDHEAVGIGVVGGPQVNPDAGA